AGTGALVQFASASHNQDAQASTGAERPSRPAGAAVAGDAAKAPTDAFAKRVWKIMELISQQHVEGFRKEVMILAGLSSVNRAAGQTPPNEETKRRIAGISTSDDFAVFMQATWPKPVAKKRTPKNPEKPGAVEDEHD